MAKKSKPNYVLISVIAIFLVGVYAYISSPIPTVNPTPEPTVAPITPTPVPTSAPTVLNPTSFKALCESNGWTTETVSPSGCGPPLTFACRCNGKVFSSVSFVTHDFKTDYELLTSCSSGESELEKIQSC